jgi:hypothetical protein
LKQLFYVFVSYLGIRLALCIHALESFDKKRVITVRKRDVVSQSAFPKEQEFAVESAEEFQVVGPQRGVLFGVILKVSKHTCHLFADQHAQLPYCI